mmetsp:Transcript_14507/g.36973  ORF Transcript_14507/g.36973 Transcript_14507/m.36973 type:complete len:206 (-) Transcript_14507:17-634(-)
MPHSFACSSISAAERVASSAMSVFVPTKNMADDGDTLLISLYQYTHSSNEEASVVSKHSPTTCEPTMYCCAKTFSLSAPPTHHTWTLAAADLLVFAVSFTRTSAPKLCRYSGEKEPLTYLRASDVLPHFSVPTRVTFVCTPLSMSRRELNIAFFFHSRFPALRTSLNASKMRDSSVCIPVFSSLFTATAHSPFLCSSPKPLTATY